jgi:hypothetical protein
MTTADITLAVFTIFNSLRFLAYVPQITKAIKDRSGAEAISFGTWVLFLASHASAMAYAIENQGDWTMAWLFLSNALGCATILLIAAWKRFRHRRCESEEIAQLRKALGPAASRLIEDLSTSLRRNAEFDDGYDGDCSRHRIRARESESLTTKACSRPAELNGLEEFYS